MSRRDLPACGVLLLAALAWAMPLVVAPATHLPGTPADHDVATMIWNVWWVQQAIETPAALFHTGAILLPFGADLRLHTFGALPAALVWPVTHAAGALAAFNLMLVGTIAANGWFAYALFRTLGAGRSAALPAAAALMLSGPVLEQMRVGRPIFASTWIICAALLAARRLLARPGPGATLALGGSLVAALFTDLQMLLYTALWLVWLAAWTGARERTVGPRRLAAAAAAVIIVAVPFLTIFYPAFAGGSAAAPSADEAVRYSFRWWDYLTPAVMPGAVGGYELAIAGAAGAWLARRDARLRFWVLGAVLFLVLALGPTLKFTGLPLPFAWLAWWPPLEQFRTPYRMAVPAAIGLAAVMALVLDRALPRLSPRIAVAIVAALLVLRVAQAGLQHPLRTQRYPVHDAYARLAAEPGGAILEVPFGVRSGVDRIGEGGEVLQYYQTLHRRPIVNAMIARLPAEVFADYRRHPALRALAGERAEATDEAIAGDLTGILDRIDARHVVVHRARLGPAHAAAVDRLLDGHPRLVRDGDDGALAVYRVRRALR